MKLRWKCPPTASGLSRQELWMTITKWMTRWPSAGRASVWMGSVSACAPVRQGRRNRPAFQPQPSPLSENSHAANGQTSSLPLLPAQSYHLRLGEDLSAHKAHPHNHLWLSKQSHEAGTAGRMPRHSRLCDVPNWKTAITEAIININ